MFNTANPTAVLGLLVSGVCLLLYGVHQMADAMQRLAGSRLRSATMALYKQPLAAFGVGVLTTALTQSSSATSSLLVGLVGAQLMPLSVAIIMLLGTNVGSTLVVQLLAFHITDYALIIVGLAAAIALLTRKTSKRELGGALVGFGLILLALAALQAGSKPITSNEITAELLQRLTDAPIVLALIGLVLAVIFSSSTATIGIVLVLASNGSLPLDGAVALMLGANVGTTIIALLTSMGHEAIEGRRLALIHTGTKSLAAVVALVALTPLTDLLAMLPVHAGMQVALGHLFFNVLLAVVFVPLAQPLASLATKLMPASVEESQPGLDPAALQSPALALGQATREILRMTDIVTNMFRRSIRAFVRNGNEEPQLIGKMDDQLDEMEDAVKRYLTQLAEDKMTPEQKRRQIALLCIVTDLEAIGDIIDRQCMRVARRKWRKQISFSQEGWNELVTYHSEVTTALQQALAALAAQDPTLADEFFERKAQLSQMKREFRLRHLQRLQSKLPPSVESSALHLEFLNAMSRVVSHASSIAHVVRGDM
ncbi:phosphate:Na+ symporter [Thermosporothrix hazakensis]|jgi:phosphate:Na+ symporter|uniref:Phosphate:Na+ symporter n=2 Tax=Thermosporothrix TaxID=768650 RepID=A0A326UDZ6_THEHA|nr:Na/Pi cotransporter family protein [Thermosporothrix hazakensis]PZW36071.1 phosphate:Na+ symporter [Thermosporothrix hazakensis]BBH88537.1 Na/Pi cotransporter II-like protein [Thermosporothrix sp. COM3]GCE46722.1 Na/Pi cotransporter II-like protein [Thermosporothrix hazakensis]